MIAFVGLLVKIIFIEYSAMSVLIFKGKSLASLLKAFCLGSTLRTIFHTPAFLRCLWIVLPQTVTRPAAGIFWPLSMEEKFEFFGAI